MTKKHFCFISILFISHFAKGQQDTTVVIKPDSVYENVDVPASFKGGREAWAKYVGNKLEYPSYALRHGIQGQVIVRFVVEEDGSIKDVEAKYGPDELHHEAIRIVQKSPKWIPAQRNGKYVKSYMSQPIMFSLHQQ
jgi:protein TonB